MRPGHIFPLQARSGGVLERQGHTEGALDLAQLAGFKPAAVLCEIMNADGSMAAGDELTAFAITHNLHVLSIQDLITYRYAYENFIIDQATTQLPLDPYGMFKMTVVKEKISGDEHIVLISEN